CSARGPLAAAAARRAPRSARRHSHRESRSRTSYQHLKDLENLFAAMGRIADQAAALQIDDPIHHFQRDLADKNGIAFGNLDYICDAIATHYFDAHGPEDAHRSLSRCYHRRLLLAFG